MTMTQSACAFVKRRKRRSGSRSFRTWTRQGVGEGGEGGEGLGFREGLSSEKISELLQNCIKLAAENKINQRNTWDLKLIDHISQIIKVEDQVDSQTNFQKASCTLEAGVKIYSYRVDSVHTDTFKVLGGLSRTGGLESNEDADGEVVDEEALQDKEEQQGKQESKKTSSATLETSWEALNVKKFDVAFAVDPLFHQTSAQFDGGGARGLLLHNLSVYGGCEIMFDSEEVPEKVVNSGGEGEGEGGRDTLDLSFMNDTIQSMLKVFEVETEITPSLREITSLLNDPRRREAAAEEGEVLPQSNSKFSEPAEQFAAGGGDWREEGDDLYDDGGEVDDFNDFCGPNDDVDSGFMGGREGKGAPGGDTEWGNDERQRERQADEESMMDGEVGNVNSASEVHRNAAQWLAAGADVEADFGTFGSSLHWRYRRPKDSSSVPSTTASESVSEKPKKKKREPEWIDFFNAADVDPTAAPGTAKQINLPKAARSTFADTLLPKYRIYDPSDLDRLFLRPSLGLWDKELKKARTQGTAASPKFSGAEFGACEGGWEEGEEDNEWGGGDVGGDFSPQRESNLDGDEGLVAAPPKVEKISVNYAKSSKQVDVRVLKETLWDQLQSIPNTSVKPLKEDEVESERETETGDSPSMEGEGVSFKELIRTLPSDCRAASSLSDISVHLCFICVLHLANEQGLELEGNAAMDELRLLQVSGGS